MAYTDQYKRYLEEIPGLASYSREHDVAPVFAYTSNLDVVLCWDVAKYNEILETFLKEEPGAAEGDVIRTMEDFSRISSFYMSQGLGGNFDITDVGVCDYLRGQFGTELALGGTCAQGAAALGAMGLPVNVHLTDECREVCRMMDHEGTTVVKDGQRIPVMQGLFSREPVYHFILQFKKGDKIKLNGREVEIPLSNRLILFYDTVHKTVPVRQDFLEYWEKAEKPPSSYLISGFDAVTDPAVMEQRLEQLEPHLKTMRQRHPYTVMYFEGAFYMNPRVKEQLTDRLSPYIDILGMNEEELAEQVKRFGGVIDISVSDSVAQGLEFLLSRYGVKGIVLHTKDYAMYYGDELEKIDIEQGLTMGNIMSATRARLGKYGSYEECRETLFLPLSAKGLEFAGDIPEKENGRYVKVVPSRYLEFPKYTIGLGDTFTAGVHTCFIRRE